MKNTWECHDRTLLEHAVVNCSPLLNNEREHSELQAQRDGGECLQERHVDAPRQRDDEAEARQRGKRNANVREHRSAEAEHRVEDVEARDLHHGHASTPRQSRQM